MLAEAEMSALTILRAFKRLLNSPLRAAAVKTWLSDQTVVLVGVAIFVSFLSLNYVPTPLFLWASVF